LYLVVFTGSEIYQKEQNKDISINRPIWMGFDEEGAALLSSGSHESCVGCRQPEIRRIAL